MEHRQRLCWPSTYVYLQRRLHITGSERKHSSYPVSNTTNSVYRSYSGSLLRRPTSYFLRHVSLETPSLATTPPSARACSSSSLSSFSPISSSGFSTKRRAPTTRLQRSLEDTVTLASSSIAALTPVACGRGHATPTLLLSKPSGCRSTSGPVWRAIPLRTGHLLAHSPI